MLPRSQRATSKASASERTFSEWTRSKREALEEQRDRTILDMYLRCYTQEAIAEAVGITQPAVNEKISEIIKNGKDADSDIFRNFDRQLYTCR